MAKTRTLGLIISDTHGGSKIGLCNPEATTVETFEDFDEEGNRREREELQPVLLCGYQSRLWNMYVNDWLERVVKIAGKDPMVAIHNGDLTQGNRFKTQLMTLSMENQYRLAAFNLLPIMQMKAIKSLYLITGTEVHIGFEGIAPYKVRDNLLLPEFKSQYKKDIPIEIANHALLSIDGYLMDIAHHGSGPGSRKWLTGNIVRYEMRSIVISEMMAGNKPPDMIVRGHYHTPIEETLVEIINDVPITIKSIVTPSMAGLNHHARRVTHSKPVLTNGFVLLDIIDGKLHDLHWLIKSFDLRTRREFINVK